MLNPLRALLVVTFMMTTPGYAAAQSSAELFAGQWTADMARSQTHEFLHVRSATLQFAFANDIVTITDSIVNASGQEIGQGTTRFQIDGREHRHDELLPGLIVVARWRDARTLETVMTRPNGHMDRVAYTVSADRRTLTNTTSGDLGDQSIVFERNK